MSELATLSLGLLLVVAFGCYLCYRTGRQRWYALFAGAWLANAGYLGLRAWWLESYAKSRDLNQFLKCEIEYYLGIPSTLLFLAALHSLAHFHSCGPIQVSRFSRLWAVALGLLGLSAAISLSMDVGELRFYVASASGTALCIVSLIGLAFTFNSMEPGDLLNSLVPSAAYTSVLQSEQNLARDRVHSDIATSQVNRNRINELKRGDGIDARSIRMLFVGRGLLSCSLGMYGMLQLVALMHPHLVDHINELWLYMLGFAFKVLFLVGIAIIPLAGLIAAENALSSVRSAELVGYLAASIEHDMRTPLHAAALHIENLKSRSMSSSELRPIRPSLEAIQRQLVRIAHTLAIIPIVRDGAEGVQMRKKRVDIRELVLEVRRALIAEFDVSKDALCVGAKERRYEVLGDRVQLIRAFENIVRNAIESALAASPNDPSVRIELNDQRNAGEMVIEVIDNGTGVTAEQLSQIGRPFYSTKVDDSQAGNRGIGVYIAALIIERHGGTFQMLPAVGGAGVVVKVVLPTQKGDLSAQAKSLGAGKSK